MKNSHKAARPEPAEDIARRADGGEDVSRFFTNRGRMMAPIQRVNVDFAAIKGSASSETSLTAAASGETERA